jgi:hypothetical protein
MKAPIHTTRPPAFTRLALIATAAWRQDKPGKAAKTERVEVIVVMSTTTMEGKKVAPPTHEHPVYYLPLVAGYLGRNSVSSLRSAGA